VLCYVSDCNSCHAGLPAGDERGPDAGVLCEPTAIGWVLVFTGRLVAVCEMNIDTGGGRGCLFSSRVIYICYVANYAVECCFAIH